MVSLDGLFLAARKEIWHQHPFDDTTFTGFHFYDVDWAAIVGQRYQVVTVNITVEHLSGGTIDRDWFDSAIAFHKKWKNKLPLRVKSTTKAERVKSEILAAARIIERCKIHSYSIKNVIACTLAYQRIYPVVTLTLGWIFYFVRIRNRSNQV